MQNPEANQLPEVDSLPDGFVEGTAEPVAPATPTPEQEKPISDYKEDGFIDCGHSNGLSNVPDCSVEGHIAAPLASSVSESQPSRSNDVKEQQQGEGQSSDKSKQPLETKALPVKDACASGMVDSSKNKKSETGEKRKGSKRALKSEKELLEFSLKYQQVLAERDAAFAVRDKLESLCRELQRQNKMLMNANVYQLRGKT